MFEIIYSILRKLEKLLSNAEVAHTSVPKSNIQVYKYSDFSIFLPSDHLLPKYQREHPLYDRFLPHLSKFLEPNSIVVDIGANCGDTLAAMVDKNREINFICIEPDNDFFGYLQKNVKLIEDLRKKNSVKVIKALVGKAISNVVLEGSGGTKKASINNNIDEEQIHVSNTLDDILLSCNIEGVRLIKSDVDGFDYDVIDSASATLEDSKPLLFFECQVDNETQKNGYKKTISELFLKGYSTWVVFDNFGNTMVKLHDPRQLEQIIEYVWRQNIGKSTRTIYYVDLLACVSEDEKFVVQVIDEYNSLSSH